MTQTSPPETPTPPPAEPVDTTQHQRRHRGVLAAGAVVVAVAALAAGWLLWPAAPGPTTLYTGTARYAVTTTLDRTQVGMTGVEIDLAGRTAGTAPPTAVDVDTVMPLMGHAMEPVAAAALGGGRFHADAVMLMTTGPWELRLTITSATGTEQLTLPLAVSG